MTTPILLAALGGLFTELAGVLNIALEGLMLIGAFTAVLITEVTGSTLLGSIGAALAGITLAYIFGFITLRFKANIFITGLAANLFAIGITNYLSSIFFGTKGVIRFTGFPLLIKFAGHNFFLYTALLFTLFAIWLINKTVFGLRLRASGYNITVLKIKGVDSYSVQMKSLLISGALSGLGGAALSLKLGAYVPGIFITCLIFAGAEFLSNAAQGMFQIPSDLLLGIPYIITFIVMIIFSILNTKSKI